MQEVIRALGVPLLCIRGTETHDVMGTLAIAATNQGLETIPVSGEKLLSLSQLDNENVVLMDSIKDITYDRAGLRKSSVCHRRESSTFLL